MSDSTNELNEGILSYSQEEEEFLLVVSEGRYRLQNNNEYQTKSWVWALELDDEGVFVFCYLLHDYNQGILSLPKLEESIYTLNLLIHRMLPNRTRSGMGKLAEYQIIFTLYEKLKQEEMSWDQCEEFVLEQVQMLQQAN